MTPTQAIVEARDTIMVNIRAGWSESHLPKIVEGIITAAVERACEPLRQFEKAIWRMAHY